jgi:hypothetical protein
MASFCCLITDKAMPSEILLASPLENVEITSFGRFETNRRFPNASDFERPLNKGD